MRDDLAKKTNWDNRDTHALALPRRCAASLRLAVGNPVVLRVSDPDPGEKVGAADD